MKLANTNLGLLALAAVAALTLAGCASDPSKLQVSDARARLSELKADTALASRATAAINDAEAAVRAAETNRKGKDTGLHLAVMAGRRVDIAWATASTKLL